MLRLGRCCRAEAGSIGPHHAQGRQLFGIRISAPGGFSSGFDGRLDGGGAFFSHPLNQTELVRRIGLRSLVRSNEIGVGVEWIHRDLVV